MRKGLLPRLDGTDGQWLLLSAIVVSIGLGALVLLLNMAILSRSFFHSICHELS